MCRPNTSNHRKCRWQRQRRSAWNCMVADFEQWLRLLGDDEDPLKMWAAAWRLEPLESERWHLRTRCRQWGLFESLWSSLCMCTSMCRMVATGGTSWRAVTETAGWARLKPIEALAKLALWLPEAKSLWWIVDMTKRGTQWTLSSGPLGICRGFGKCLHYGYLKPNDFGISSNEVSSFTTSIKLKWWAHTSSRKNLRLWQWLH